MINKEKYENEMHQQNTLIRVIVLYLYVQMEIAPSIVEMQSIVHHTKTESNSYGAIQQVFEQE